MSKPNYRFTATISRGDCFHRKMSGTIKSASTPRDLLHCLSQILSEHDDGLTLGELDSIVLRISRIKPRKAKP